MATLKDRLVHAWDVFRQEDDPYRIRSWNIGPSYGTKPDRTRLLLANERSIISSIYNRMAIDVASTPILHVKLDDNKRFVEEIPSHLNSCFTIEANLDQAARHFRQDLALTLFDKGVAAIVPIDTTVDPDRFGSFDVKTMRIGYVTQWFPEHVEVEVFKQDLGHRVSIIRPKRSVAIVENPLYLIMNEPNSTLQRLIRKLNMLDVVDDRVSSGKLDIIIQLPYVIKSETRRQQAEQRRQDIEFQLKGSQYGIAYTDGTEKITQLNRPAENNLLQQVEYLKAEVYEQLGVTPEILNNTADEKALLNYHNRTIEPIQAAIAEAMKRRFLTKTARTQGQSIEYYDDPFRRVPVENVAEIADKFTRNEIMTSNELRQVIGMKPSTDPKADELRNSNMPRVDSEEDPAIPPVERKTNQNGT